MTQKRWHLSPNDCDHDRGVCPTCDFDRYYARTYVDCPWREGGVMGDARYQAGHAAMIERLDRNIPWDEKDRAEFDRDAFLWNLEEVAKAAAAAAAANILDLIQGPPMDEYDRAIADAIHAIAERA